MEPIIQPIPTTIKKDLTGQVFTWLTVLGYGGKYKSSRSSAWVCECRCGAKVVVCAGLLVVGKCKSCGCYQQQSRQESLVGKRFGKLTVLKFAGYKKNGQQNISRWMVRCDCGREKEMTGKQFTSGHSKTCGCGVSAATIKRNTTHGKSGSPEFFSYYGAKERCNNPNDNRYPNYGGRGIRFLFESFESFLEHMGERPPGTSIDRIDNNGHYEPGNCRWATDVEQAVNRRNNVMLTVDGVTKTISEHIGTSKCAAYMRVIDRLTRGWCHKCAVTVPQWGPRCKHRTTEATASIECQTVQ